MSKEKEKEIKESASSVTMEVDFPTDILRRFIQVKNINQEISKEISSRFFVIVTFPVYSVIPTNDAATSVVRLRGIKSQLDRAATFLKRGLGSFKENHREKGDEGDRGDKEKSLAGKKKKKDYNSDSDDGRKGREVSREVRGEREVREVRDDRERKVVSEGPTVGLLWKSHNIVEKEREREVREGRLADTKEKEREVKERESREKEREVREVRDRESQSQRDKDRERDNREKERDAQREKDGSRDARDRWERE